MEGGRNDKQNDKQAGRQVCFGRWAFGFGSAVRASWCGPIHYTKTITLKGTVKSWLWSNPHCLLTFDVKGDDGQDVEWIAETQAPSTIYPQGFRKDSFKPGDQVTVTVQPAKNGRPNGRLLWL